VLVAEAVAELAAAVAELRELASGVYPAALAEHGLPAALDALAARSAVPVRVTASPGVRLPAAVEHACWFTASELLANAAKHAAAGCVEVDLRVTGGRVVLRVVDDGVGGADPDGSGLRGLADRVASAGGHLALRSPPGAGTRAVATFTVATDPASAEPVR
jgi:signal transduction histidine kinase